MENLDRCRIFDSTDFEKLDETTSGRHFRRKFLEREVGDQKVSSQEQPVDAKMGISKPLKTKIIFSGISKIQNQIYFSGFQKFKNLYDDPPVIEKIFKNF